MTAAALLGRVPGVGGLVSNGPGGGLSLGGHGAGGAPAGSPGGSVGNAMLNALLQQAGPMALASWAGLQQGVASGSQQSSPQISPVTQALFFVLSLLDPASQVLVKKGNLPGTFTVGPVKICPFPGLDPVFFALPPFRPHDRLFRGYEVT